MENKGVIFIVGAGILAYLLLAEKKAIGLLNYVIKGIGVSFEGVQPILNIQVAIQNVSNYQFTISSLVGTLTQGSVVLGNVSNFNPVVVPPSSEVIYPLSIRLNLIGVASDIFNLIQSKSGNPISISLSGEVNANGTVVPFTIPYTIKY